MLRLIAWAFSLGSLALLAALGGLAAVVWHYGSDLPDHAELAEYRPAVISHVHDQDGRAVAEFFSERRVFAPEDEIPDLVKQAFISAEDRNFYDHSGFDALGIAAAVADFARGERLRGASTITQQVMKNFLLSSERSFDRKIKEIILAVRIEQVLSKDQILELYLNEIYLGARAYGVAAAAAAYFGKPLEALSVAEAAYLAALPKAPSSLDPIRNRDTALARRAYVLGQMRRNGVIDEAQLAEAMADPLHTVLDGTLAPMLPRVPRRDYFTEEIRRQLIARMGEDQVLGGGLSIRATLDPDLQAVAAQALRDQLEAWDRERLGWRGAPASLPAEALTAEAWPAALAAVEAPRDIPGWRPAVTLEVGANGATLGVEGEAEPQTLPFAGMAWARPARGDAGPGAAPRSPADVLAPGDVVLVARDGADGPWTLRQVPEIQGAFMAMDPVTGRVLAMQGGFSHGASEFNRATQAQRQPGSAFKPFVYAAALDNGYTPATIILDAPLVVDTGAADLWRPSNASNRFHGPAPMRVGIEQSRNLMTVRLAQAVGMDVVTEYAERFGVYRDTPPHLSYALGAGETTLFQMVAAYAMFANGGLQVEPTLIDRVQDRRGATLWRHDPRACRDCEGPLQVASLGDTPWPVSQARRIMDPVTAHQLTEMMQGVVQRGTATRLQSLGRPVAGKTGTTNEARDAWFLGYTPDLVAGCYIGFDTPRPMGRGAYGGTLCVPVFEAFMKVALADRPVAEFRPPQGAFTAKLDAATGRRLPDDAEGPGVIVESFRWNQIPEIGEIAVPAARLVDDAVGPVSGGDLPMTLLPVTDEDAAETPAPASSTGDADRPTPPRPPTGGFSARGLY